MNIFLAGEKMTVKKNATLSDVLTTKTFPMVYAIALNKQFIPFLNYKTTILNDNDHIEIILPMQGG